MRSQEHERYSELLKPYLEGRLGVDETALVDEHLAGCPECSAELVALKALLTEPAPGLSDLERAHLHRTLEEARAVPASPGWRAKLVPALSAAALIAIVAIGITTIDFGGSDQDATSGADSGAVQDADTPEMLEAAPAPGSLPYAARFVDLGKVSERGLNNLGSSGFVANAELFAPARTAPVSEGSEQQEGGGGDNEANTPADATSTKRARRKSLDRDAVVAAQGPALAALATKASDPVLAAQINECGAQVLDSHPYLTLPVFASTARLKDTPVLVLGFRWREEGPGNLNRYQVWAWPLGVCDVNVYYSSGRIR